MSADKLQAVHEALAAVFNESKLNATGTETSYAAFDNETLSEAFSEPQLNVANTEQSFARFNHAALTGIFRESFPTSSTEGPSPTSFDQAFAEILREPPPISTNIKPSQPSFDHQALAEMLSELRADPINPQMSPLSFDTESPSAPFSGQTDHEEPVVKAFAVAPSTNAEGARPQRAKSLLAKLHHIFSTKEEPLLSNVEKDPLPPSLSGQPHTPEPMAKAISTLAESTLPEPAKLPLAELSPLSFEQEPKSSHLSVQPGNGRSAVSDVAVTSPTDAASAWPLQATSLPNEISSPISTNTQSSPPTFERKPSTASVAGPLGNVVPDVKVVAVAAPVEAENARPQQARSSLVEPVSPSSNNIEPPSPIFEKGYSGPILPGRIDLENVEPAEKPDVERAQPQLTELPPLISPSTTPPLVLKTEPSRPTDTEPQPFIFENESSPIDPGQPDPAEPAPEIVAAAPLPDAEDARPQQGKSLLADLPPSRSFFERKPSHAIFSGELDKVGPAVETVAATPPAHAVTAQQTKSLPLTDLPALVTTNTKSSFPSFEQDLPSPSLSGQPGSVVQSVKSVVAAHPTEAEGALPQHASSLLAALRVLNAKPSPPIPEKEASRSTFARQPDNAGMSVETIAHPTDAESALARQTRSLLTKMPALVSTDAKSSASIFEKEPSLPPLSDQPTDVAPTAKAVAVAPPADTESAVTRAQQAKSLLAELDPNTAIHLRWVMRDIRSKRTKFSPVSANDLSALMDLGLVEMREELPRLTGLGVLALD